MAEREVAPVGARSRMGIGLQPDSDSPVLVDTLLRYRSGGPEGNQELLFGEANDDSPDPRDGAVVGDWSGDGDFTVEATPRKAIPKLLTMLLGNPVSETVLSTNTPAAPTHVTGGVAGATVRKYWIVARKGGYPSVPSTALVASDTNATLSVANKVTLTWAAVTGAESYDVLYAPGAGATIANAKRIGIVTAPTVTFDHTGAQTLSEYATITVPISKKRWKHTWERRWGSVAQKKGDSVFFFPFCSVHSMSTQLQRGDKSVITMTFGVKPSNMILLCDNGSTDGRRTAAIAEAGLDTALFDSATRFSPALSIVKIADVGSAFSTASAATNFNCSLSRKSDDEYCLNGQLGPHGFSDGLSELSCSFDAYFRKGTESDLKRFMGRASDASSEVAAGFQGVVREVAISCLFKYPSGRTFDYSIEYIYPRCTYSALGIPVQGRDGALMQNISVSPNKDATEGTSMIIEIVSDETMADILDDTGDPFVPPANAVQL